MAGRVAAIVASSSLVAVALPAAADALSVGNPPAHAGAGFTLAVKGAGGTVSVYLSPVRKPAKGDVLLGRLKAKHGKLELKVASRVKAGSYYVLVCTGAGRRLKCGSSAHKTSVSHAAASSPTSTGTTTASTSSTVSSTSGGGGGSSTPGGGGGGSSPKGGEEVKGGEEEHLEPGKPVERKIEKGKEGGIGAEGVEGTKYKLVYVAEAAEPEIDVKLTPITSVTGASGTMVGGVEIEPAGTLFVRDAYLIITPPGPISESGREAVKFTGTGQELHGTPFVQQGNGFILPVAGGGGYALFTGATIKKLAVPRRTGLASVLSDSFAHPDGTPPGAQATYENELAEALQSRTPTQANDELSEENSQLNKEIKETLGSWYEEIEFTKIPPGETEDEAAEEAIMELCAGGRAGALLLGDLGEKVIYGEVINKAEGMSKVYGTGWEEKYIFEPSRKLAASAYNRNQEKCASKHDLTKIEKIISWERTYQLLGGAEVALEQLFECEHFTVTFESTMTDTFKGENGDASGKWANGYKAVVKVKPKIENSSTFPLLGEAIGGYTETEGKTETTVEQNGKTCIDESIEQSGTGAPFNITALTVPNGLGAAAGGPAVTLNPGMPHENVLTQATPSECDPFPMVVPEYSWWADWDAEHQDADISQEAFEYKFPLTGGSGAEIGSVEFTDVPFNKGNAEGKEDTTIKVMHTPGSFNRL